VSRYSNKTLKSLQQTAWESPTNRVFNELHNSNKRRKGGGKKSNKETTILIGTTLNHSKMLKTYADA